MSGSELATEPPTRGEVWLVRLPRAVGAELGLPADILGRHPFPGPGLAVRVLGEVTEERADILREADGIFIEMLRGSGWYEKVWQAFAVLLPVRTV